jgi:HlyD family secretion protein
MTALALDRRKLLYGALAIAAAAIVAWGFFPDPVAVEVAEVRRGPLEVTVDEDAETRARDHYVVSAPVAGRVSRIELREGDRVAEGQLVAQLWAAPLTARQREEQKAKVAAAEALVREANEKVRHAEADHAQARRERERVDKLVAQGFLSPQGAEQSRTTEVTSANEAEAARSRARFAEAELRAARAALYVEGALPGQPAPAISLRAPADGRVLRIADRSERVVAAGASLVTLGDPSRLEVVIDLLTTEAVKVKPGMPVRLEGWGGAGALAAKVRVVEPLAFTKVSALGVEEQRVNVIADFVDPPGPLGDAFRVEARVVLWRGEDVLKLPVSALFRRGERWSVFVAEGGRARVRDVAIGQRGTLEAEVTGGLKEGERVVRHPSNELGDGARVRVADAG